MHACCVVTVQLQSIVGALRTLVAWQQQQHEAGAQQPMQPGMGAAPGMATSKAGSSGKVAPSELHRQLFEERELTSQLQARIRQLQQELLLAGGPAVAATVPLPTSASVTPAPAGKQHVSTAARLARLSPGVGVHYSADAACVRALHVAPAALESAFAEVSGGGALREPAAVAVEPAACGADLEAADVLQGSPCCLAPEGHDMLAPGGLHAEPVVVQISINAPESSKAAEQEPAGAAVQEQQKQPDEGADAAAAEAAAAATIAEQQQVIDGLQAQLTELQERLDASQREQLSFNSKWQSVKALVAAARCSTPSSQLSSSLTSPQPSFGPLEPVFGVSERSQPPTRSQCGLRTSTSTQPWAFRCCAANGACSTGHAACMQQCQTAGSSAVAAAAHTSFCPTNAVCCCCPCVSVAVAAA